MTSNSLIVTKCVLAELILMQPTNFCLFSLWDLFPLRLALLYKKGKRLKINLKLFKEDKFSPSLVLDFDFGLL